MVSNIRREGSLPALLHPDKLLSIKRRFPSNRLRTQETPSYVGAELEVAHTADNILVVRVIEMTIEHFLRQSERTLEPRVQ